MLTSGWQCHVNWAICIFPSQDICTMQIPKACRREVVGCSAPPKKTPCNWILASATRQTETKGKKNTEEKQSRNATDYVTFLWWYAWRVFMPHSLSAQWKEGTLPGKLTTNGSQLEGQMWSSELTGPKTILGQAERNNPSSTATQLKKKKIHPLILGRNADSWFHFLICPHIWSVSRAQVLPSPLHELICTIITMPGCLPYKKAFRSKTGRTCPVRGSFPCPLLMITQALVHRVRLSSSGKQAAHN